jgi:hypothetical protein
MKEALDSVRWPTGRRGDDHAEPFAIVPIDVNRPQVINVCDGSLRADSKATTGIGLAEG